MVKSSKGVKKEDASISSPSAFPLTSFSFCWSSDKLRIYLAGKLFSWRVLLLFQKDQGKKKEREFCILVGGNSVGQTPTVSSLYMRE